MANIGKFNRLRIVETSEHGLYLDGGTRDNILLPNRYVTPEMCVGEAVDVFLYNDSEDRLIATTETPHAQVGEYAYLEVLDVKANVGAFLDWGLSKDLLLPYREQGDLSLRKGDGVIVAVYLDAYTDRIVASTRLHRTSATRSPTMPRIRRLMYWVCGIPAWLQGNRRPQAQGLLFYSETPTSWSPATSLPVMSECGQGKMICGVTSGYERVGPLTEQILKALEDAGGSLPFNDRSTPDSIRDAFDCSKKAFKQALGALYKQRSIEFVEGGIRLIAP